MRRVKWIPICLPFQAPLVYRLSLLTQTLGSVRTGCSLLYAEKPVDSPNSAARRTARAERKETRRTRYSTHLASSLRARAVVFPASPW
ncbi:hypothetical protein GQ53DRAFT_190070 [Thozetella sp. PMI_491]|nr:hypothetical protein GQ53DRAFT_190070 [Thozetella sp. PMI_491]